MPMPYIHIGYLYSYTRECPEHLSRSDVLTSHVMPVMSKASRTVKETHHLFCFPFT